MVSLVAVGKSFHLPQRRSTEGASSPTRTGGDQSPCLPLWHSATSATIYPDSVTRRTTHSDVRTVDIVEHVHDPQHGDQVSVDLAKQ